MFSEILKSVFSIFLSIGFNCLIYPFSFALIKIPKLPVVFISKEIATFLAFKSSMATKLFYNSKDIAIALDSPIPKA